MSNRLTEDDLKKADTDRLCATIRVNEHEKAEIEANIKMARAELARRLAPELDAKLKAAGKTHGQQQLDGTDLYKITAKISASRSYDQDALMALARTMPFEDAAHLFKFKIEPQAAVVKGLLPSDPKREQIANATITTFSGPAITVENKEDA